MIYQIQRQRGLVGVVVFVFDRLTKLTVYRRRVQILNVRCVLVLDGVALLLDEVLERQTIVHNLVIEHRSVPVLQQLLAIAAITESVQ